MNAVAHKAAFDTRNPTRTAIPFLVSLIVILTLVRFATAAYLPVSFDEAYFWLWSRRLAISYFEHPPLIALAIRAGTALFGDTSFGVRFVPLLASVAASWAVWQSAFLLCDELIAWTACAFFNATLMVASQGMAATPDIFVMAASALMILSIVALEKYQDPRWWLVTALSLGFALLAKYTAFFLGLSLLGWLVISPQGRAWLWSPWPYVAACVALLFFVPNLVWNETHGWISFRYQFGRIVAGSLTPRYFLEFLGGQLALCSPCILVLAALGFVDRSRVIFKGDHFAILITLIWPVLVYFPLHSLHDRVQGNWPSFIYPAIAVLAATAAYQRANADKIVDWLRNLALPFAALILLIGYVQTWAGLLSLGISDPVARMTAVGFRPVAREIADRAAASRVTALVTTRYVNTGWLAFYVQPHLPILQAAEEYRWTDAPSAPSRILAGPLLYVTQNPKRELQFITPLFAKVTFERCIPRIWSGVVVDSFCVYRLEGFRAAARVPQAYTPNSPRALIGTGKT